MRDVLVLGIILLSVPICFFRPYFGALMWVWVAYFNPHRFTYGFAYHFPVSTAVAIPTILGIILQRKVNRHIFVRETILLLLFWVWMVISFIHATRVELFNDHIEDAAIHLSIVTKVLLMTFILILVVNSKEKLKILFIVTALCLGALAIKGSVFGATTEGNFRVWGPPDSFLYDNNDLGLALNMTLPMMYYLTRVVVSRYLRIILWVCFASGAIVVLLTYSRGALLGLTVVLGSLVLRSNKKILGAAVLVGLVMLVLAFAPPAWMDRMSGFAHGDVDQSAQGRLNAWQFAWVFASAYPITGGSFETFTPQLESRFTPQFPFAGPHSIYFQTLGEQGFVGLGIFLALLGSCFFSLWRLRRRVRGHPSLFWVGEYSKMLETCLLAYVVSGAFLPRAYFDLWFQLAASTALLKILLQHELLQESEEIAINPSEENLLDVAAV
jgi:putative inorganic carbon (HCO3(-)) transporter